MKNIYALFLALLVLGTSCKKDPALTDEAEQPVDGSEAGLITFAPAFPSENEPLTITFDAAKGNQGLNNFSGEVYLYSGVITDKSSSASDWKYVKSTSFNIADPACKMSAIGSNKYQISIIPRSFFGVPAGEKILKLAMLFKNTDGTQVSRNSDNSDIYLTLYEGNTLNVRFTSPETEPFYIPAPVIKVQAAGDELTVSAVASRSAELTLTLNGSPFASATGTTITGKVKITGSGNQQVKIIGKDGSHTAESAFSFPIHGAVQIAELPTGISDGVTFLNNGTSAIFNLYAPNKNMVYVLGDFNDWQTDSKYFMKRTPDGNHWWIQIDNLDPNREYGYQFLIDGKLRLADPYSEKVLDPEHDRFIPATTYPNLKPYPQGKTTGIVSTMQAIQPAYNWKTSAFTRPEKKDLVIYELLVRDFVAERNYGAMKNKLTYLASLGVNAIELMPVQEFEGNSSWGYNPSFYFAPDKYYGTKNSLKEFIDECHQRGIAVIMDMVLNHSFGQSPMVQMYFDQSTGKPAVNSPWFNADATHPYNVGYDFNHEKPATQAFVKNVLQFWMKEYKIDGYRFDLSKGFTQKNSGTSDAGTANWSAYDAGRIAIWKNYNNYLRSLDPKAYIILEHFAADTEEKVLAAEGMLLWNNLNHNANEATMGYVAKSDLTRGLYNSHEFSETNALISYIESHDEERLMYKNLQYGNASATYSTKELTTSLKRQEMAAALFFALPGPKMVWQFGELGYDISINQNGRTGEKPLHWEYLDNPQRKALQTVYSRMIKFKTGNPVFSTTNYDYNLTGGVKYIILKSSLANVVVMGNFDVSPQSATITFPKTGVWTDQLTGQVINISNAGYTTSLSPGEYHVYSDTPLVAN